MRVLLLALAALSAAATVSAGEFKAGDLLVMHPVVRATPGGAKVGGGYLTVRNTGSMPDRLVAIESSIAGRVEIHASSIENGIASMRALTNGLPVPAGGEATLSPGGNHVMFVDLKAPFRTGETVSATLIFERAGRVPVTFAVEPIGGAKPAGATHQGH
jgi:periplasmic copper chaperone A